MFGFVYCCCLYVVVVCWFLIAVRRLCFLLLVWVFKCSLSGVLFVVRRCLFCLFFNVCYLLCVVCCSLSGLCLLFVVV